MLLSWLKELQRNNLDEDSIINLKELRGVFKNVSKETFSNSSFLHSCARVFQSHKQQVIRIFLSLLIHKFFLTLLLACFKENLLHCKYLLY